MLFGEASRGGRWSQDLRGSVFEGFGQSRTLRADDDRIGRTPRESLAGSVGSRGPAGNCKGTIRSTRVAKLVLWCEYVMMTWCYD